MLKELEFPFDSSYLIKKKKSLRRLLLENENQNKTRLKKNIQNSKTYLKRLILIHVKKSGLFLFIFPVRGRSYFLSLVLTVLFMFHLRIKLCRSLVVMMRSLKHISEMII